MGDFNLWNPAVVDGGRQVGFDVTCSTSRQLNQGSLELVAGFLRKLGIVAVPVSYEMIDFARAYYTDVPDAENYLDRYRMAWRLSVRLAEPLGETTLPQTFAPLAGDGNDPTWQNAIGAWRWSERDYWSIAHLLDADEKNWMRWIASRAAWDVLPWNVFESIPASSRCDCGSGR